MSKTIKKYIWLFEWIAASIILAVGFVIGFVDGVVLIATGISLVLIALLRSIPLIKTLKDKLMKWINFGEILINIIVGIVMIVLAINSWKEDSEIVLGNVYGYLLGGVLFLRGVVYFIGTSFRDEHTDITKFIANLLFLSVGVWFISRPTDEKTLGYFVLGIACLCALFIIFDGIKNYNNYRHEYCAESVTKQISKKVENTLELPNNDTTKKDEVEEPISEIIPIDESDDQPGLNA